MEWKFASHACNYSCPECLTIFVLLYNVTDACQLIEDTEKQIQNTGLDQVKGDPSPICPR